ncbi:MAG: hypothetical protein C3F02_03175 [Parcubacteria group bacterium]|nr:MAG: hypothetical protein C3F02_03175 [Parcubacteria group bacterium]
MVTLGKGLGALIPNKKNQNSAAVDDAIADGQRIQQVPITAVKSNPWQPRTYFDRDKLEELAESIKQHGILQPLVVTREGDGYQLIAGERRLKAAEILGMSEVPVIVKVVSNRDKLELSIIENIQRSDLNPLEEANSYKRLMDEFGLSLEAIANQVGKNISTISNSLRLLSLPIVIKEALSEGKITASHAKLILSYQTKNEQIKVFKKILKSNLTVQALYDLTKKDHPKNKIDTGADPVLGSWEEKLSKALSAKVSISKRGERGQIKIDFFSHEELKNILDKLTK